ncbi:deoxyuridine triphosphate [Alphabaculovirus altersperidaniae]|uniref:dUTP diphosphatase n=1 Tax=Spodoptera eridania nucleopolyhedrovirus TaxID=2315721 RepID=A0ABX6TR21_9ABAC|nr:deoxyuridine triphosphate [Spodoptera eridania nucleopolyhedrovirus]QNV47802.1 deoxyuridine triphosphate [Spodoptera eridania nucleopolyhedrovirus]
MSAQVLRFKKTSNAAYTPRMASDGAAGYDLHTPVDFVVKARDSILIDTDVAIQLPPRMYAQIKSRSGNAAKYQVVAAAGVIDNDYRGSLKVLLFNHGKKSRQFKRGDRIAQFIVREYIRLPVEEVDELTCTERNTGGFGSTGQ